MKKEYIFLSVLILTLIISMLVFTKSPKPNSQTIVTSLYPIGFLTEQITKSNVQVMITTPIGTEPHDYEPTPKQLAEAEQATVFIFIGGGIDPWAEKVAQARADKGSKSINLTSEMKALAPNDTNPHYWLDPIRTQQLIKIINKEITIAFPDLATAFEKNTQLLTNELTKIDSEYNKKLSNCAQQIIVVDHNAFEYVASRYQFQTIVLKGNSPEDEPTPKTIAEAIEKIKSARITTVFTEPLSNQKTGHLIANETGATIKVLSPIEGLTAQDIEQQNDYFSIMNENLINISNALACSQS